MELRQIQNDPKGYFRRLRWHGTVACPVCGSLKIYTRQNGYTCGDCHHHFSDTSGTIFHSSKLPLVTWLTALYYLLRSSRGISSYNLGRYLGIPQPTAWRVLTRLRRILPRASLSGVICLDEVYIGPEWKWIPDWKKVQLARAFKDPRDVVYVRNLGKRVPSLQGTRKYLSNIVKRPMLGIIEYGSRKLVMRPLPNPVTRESVESLLYANTSGITRIVTDQSHIYDKIPLPRSICNHSEEQYVSKDGFSSNKIENVFSQLRRTIHGIYGWFSKRYEDLYLDEFAFRFTYRRRGFGEILDIISNTGSLSPVVA